MSRLDCAIIGTGPAGLEAALNLKIRNKSFLLFGNANLSRKIETAPMVDNYLGLAAVTGKQLQQAFRQHLEQMEIPITCEQVSTIYDMGDYFSLASNRETYEATTIILATGIFSSKLYPGEEEFLGRGVGYCATCDAPLYKGKTVAIVGWGDEAVREANFVKELAGTVYYIPVRKHTLPLADGVILVEDRVREIGGDKQVQKLILANDELDVDGVFILRETIAPTSLVPGLEMRDGFVAVDADMRTNLSGCFAAGDCTGKPHQYMRAAGQGQTAALNAVAYIDSLANV